MGTTVEMGALGRMGAMANGLKGEMRIQKINFSNYGIAGNTTLNNSVGVWGEVKGDVRGKVWGEVWGVMWRSVGKCFRMWGKEKKDME